MKKSKQCPKCESRAIGYLPSQPDHDDRESVGTTERPVGTVKVESFIFTSTRPVGRLEAYVCTECGYHETYVADPRAVPWNEIEGFRWVNPPPTAGGPYR